MSEDTECSSSGYSKSDSQQYRRRNLKRSGQQTRLVNIPLTDGQKLLLRSYQNNLNLLAKQKSEIDVQVARVEGAMQLDMMKIATRE